MIWGYPILGNRVGNLPRHPDIWVRWVSSFLNQKCQDLGLGIPNIAKRLSLWLRCVVFGDCFTPRVANDRIHVITILSLFPKRHAEWPADCSRVARNYSYHGLSNVGIPWNIPSAAVCFEVRTCFIGLIVFDRRWSGTGWVPMNSSIQLTRWCFRMGTDEGDSRHATVVPRKDAFWLRQIPCFSTQRRRPEQKFPHHLSIMLDRKYMLLDRKHIFVVSGSVAIPKYGRRVLWLTEVWARPISALRLADALSGHHERSLCIEASGLERRRGVSLAKMGSTTWGNVSFKLWDGLGKDCTRYTQMAVFKNEGYLNPKLHHGFWGSPIFGNF